MSGLLTPVTFGVVSMVDDCFVTHPDAQSLLDAAMAGLSHTDPELEGARVTRWYVVAEHEAPADGDRTLSIFRSASIRPWDALGLLEFAKTVEKDNIMFGDSREDDE
jgi:hypothetical protein